MKTDKLILVLVLFGLVVMVAITGVFVLSKQLVLPPGQQACTMEAKMCPDGSAVGRTGPNCEFAACPNVIQAAFGSPITFTVGKTVTMPDFSDITLVQINDSRCQVGVVCIWAGELSPVFNVNGFGNEASQSMQITLGTTTAKQITKNGYTFSLQDATESSATIIVTKDPQALGDCYTGGCSSQVCSDKEGVITTCEYKQEYVCYKNATCERQSNGQCGWTQTPQLTSCINNSN